MILVTGGYGFIGGYVCDQLDEPLIFDRYSKNSKYQAFLGDITNATSVNQAMSYVDGFIHLAGVLGTQETIKNPIPSATTNLIGGLNILEAAAEYGVPGVYIGVGNYWMDNTYSISKTTIERFINMYNRFRGTQINIVRAMNAYGPKQIPAQPYGNSRVRKITPSFICRALAGDPIELYGGGHQVSDMVYVDDVAKALVKALEKAQEGIVFDKAVEIGPEKHNTVREVAELILEITDSKSELMDLPMRPGEIVGKDVIADISTLDYIDMSINDLMPLREGMERTIKYYRDKL